MSELLELRHITRSFGDVVAVNHLSLEVPAGQFVTLLGPSGCGKTTTLRLIAGFDPPDSGTIRLKGRTLAGAGVFIPPQERRIGMVFQEYALFPHLDVAGNIAFGVKGAKTEVEARVIAMLKLVGLSRYGRRMPYELSGGQQQRVALARALAPQPDVLLLDEPFSNLDTALRAHVRAEVQTILRQTGTTTIFVTHDRQEALSLSDKVAVMFAGRIAQIDTPHHLYRYPASREVAQFVGEANFLPALAAGMTATSMLGELRLHHPMQGAIEVMIRPERLSLSSDGGTEALVLWSEYYGHSQRVGLALSDDTRLVARTGEMVVYTPGDRVRVQVTGAVMGYT